MPAHKNAPPIASARRAKSHDCVLALHDAEGQPKLVGLVAGEAVPDVDLRAHSPLLGRALAMLRRMDDIVERTTGAPDRRGALLAEMTDWYWNDELAAALKPADETPRSPRPGLLPDQRPEIDAQTIWTIPE